MRVATLQKVFILIGLLLLALFMVMLVGEFSYPFAPPNRNDTLSMHARPTPQEIGSFDLLGHVISRAEAEEIRRSGEGLERLSPEHGAQEITPELIAAGRDAFYLETFNNEDFFTDVMGALDGPINPWSVTLAILKLGGRPTNNLQIELTEDVQIGDRLFRRGELLNTGLDVPAGSLAPLGTRVFWKDRRIKMGMTCAACHATVDPGSGRIIEGAPNLDLNSSLMLAAATNSAAFFRQTGVNPTELPPGTRKYINDEGERAVLPDPAAVERAVDNDLLSWMPGNFDSTGDMVNNPSQIPTSFTFGAWPYSWTGFAQIGYFQGLTTLNNNVHATNSDMTTGVEGAPELLGMGRETYLGVILQNSASPHFRLPEGVRPTAFFERVNTTRLGPAINNTQKMPGYPQGSMFVMDGLTANTPDQPFLRQLNGMSAFQNTLSPPTTHLATDANAILRGRRVFEEAACNRCHAGPFYTNNRVIPVEAVQSQPSRARALAAFPRIFTEPLTFPLNAPVPVPPGTPTIPVPMDISPEETRQLAYAINSNGGYKVQSLVGLAVSPPYLHDGGVTAALGSITPGPDGYYEIRDERRVGAAGTLYQHIPPDPAVSLRFLVDRSLRERLVAINRATPEMQRSNADGSGHPHWVDRQAGFTPQQQVT